MNVIEVVIVVAQRGENAWDRQKHHAHYHQPQRTADWPSSFPGNWNARWWILVRAIRTHMRALGGKTRLIVCAICGKGPRQHGLSLVQGMVHFLNRMIYFLTMFISCSAGGKRLFQVAAVLSPLPPRHPGESVSDSLSHYWHVYQPSPFY